jgi:hypothetical protein
MIYIILRYNYELVNISYILYICIKEGLFMSDKKRQVLVGLTDELLEQIDEYRFANKIGSRSEAIRVLLEQALKATQK